MSSISARLLSTSSPSGFGNARPRCRSIFSPSPVPCSPHPLSRGGTAYRSVLPSTTPWPLPIATRLSIQGRTKSYALSAIRVSLSATLVHSLENFVAPPPERVNRSRQTGSPKLSGKLGFLVLPISGSPGESRRRHRSPSGLQDPPSPKRPEVPLPSGGPKAVAPATSTPLAPAAARVRRRMRAKGHRGNIVAPDLPMLEDVDDEASRGRGSSSPAVTAPRPRNPRGAREWHSDGCSSVLRIGKSGTPTAKRSDDEAPTIARGRTVAPRLSRHRRGYRQPQTGGPDDELVCGQKGAGGGKADRGRAGRG